jgi:hypothetical protein
MSLRPVEAPSAPPPTLPELDLREVPRFSCGGRPLVRLIVRPDFTPVPVGVCDLSCKGMGFLSEAPIDVGASIAVLWDFGPPKRWRTLLARIIHFQPRPRGGWLIGCEFEDRLEDEDVEACLRIERDPIAFFRED